MLMNFLYQGAAMAVFSLLMAASPAAETAPASGSTAQAGNTAGPAHDFDFLVGRWRSHHRKLKERLANNHEWIEFEGTLSMHTLMDGSSNVDDNVFYVPGGTYHGVGLRAYDAKTQQWSIWWLDSRMPLGPLDPPVRGSFHNGVGTFYSDDTLRGKPVRLRFIWSGITANTCHWEQALSADGGKTWETNWTMDFTRDVTPVENR
jgi:Protein of unknown function (DUF1579)